MPTQDQEKEAFHEAWFNGDMSGIQKITSSYYAYCWAKYIGNKDTMKYRIRDEEIAYAWACDFGDVEIMRDYIVSPKYAYKWALAIGDVREMWAMVKGSDCEAAWSSRGLPTFDVDMKPSSKNCRYCKGTGKWMSPGGFGTYYDCLECK